MKISSFLSVLFAGLLILPFSLYAQPEKDVEKEKEMERNIELLRIWEMTKELDLTEEQVAKIFPALSRIGKEISRLQKEIRKELMALKSLIETEKKDESMIKDKINILKKLRKKIQMKEEETLKVLEKHLTLEQQARYVLFAGHFMEKLREKLEHIRMLRERGLFEERERGE